MQIYKKPSTRLTSPRFFRLLTLALIACVAAGCGDGRRADPPAPPPGDAGVGQPDVGPNDAGEQDSRPIDGGIADTGVFDSGVFDSGVIDSGPTLGFGETCSESTECTDGLCFEPRVGDRFCTRECDLSRANDCRSERTLCLRTASGTPSAVCAGPTIETGSDMDDAILGLGDCVSRRLNPVGVDRDLFRMEPATTAPVQVVVRPDPTVDVELEIFDPGGALVATSAMNGPGGIEGLRFDSWDPREAFYILVIDSGSSVANPYQICVEPSE